ncbi:MAG: hypothetical protein VB138_09390 [Burkholderia sp.]
MNNDPLELILRADRFVGYVRVGLGCAILALLVVGRLKGLI